MSRVLLQGRPCAPVFLAASEAKASAASGSDWQCIGEPRLEVLAAKSLKTGVGCCYSVRRSGLKLYCGRWRSQALAAVSLSALPSPLQGRRRASIKVRLWGRSAFLRAIENGLPVYRYVGSE